MNKLEREKKNNINCSPLFMYSIGLCANTTVLTKFPQCNFLQEFPETLSQSLMCHHWLSAPGNSKTMHCGILINMPYSWSLTVAGAFSYAFLQFMIVYYLLCSRAFHIFVLRHKTEAKTANQCNYTLYCEMFPMFQFPNNVRITRRSIITVIQC